MIIISGTDCLTTWKSAVAKISDKSAGTHNLLLEISDTRNLPRSWLADYNPKRFGPSFDNINDVISTIFPVRQWKKASNRNELYRAYCAVYKRGKKFKRNRGAWGTYFHRLIQFGSSPQINQLEEVISKLIAWSRVEAALTFHLTAPNVDRPRRLGGPCWHFGELIWHKNDTVDLVAVYRNHDYFNKALGNFIGLASLLNFICDESGKRPGRLICHSIHVYQSTSFARLKRLARI